MTEDTAVRASCGVLEYDWTPTPSPDIPPDPPPAVCDRAPDHDGMHSGVRHARRLRWCDHRVQAGSVLPCKECKRVPASESNDG